MNKYNTAPESNLLSSEAYASKCDKGCDAAVLKSDTLPAAESYFCSGGDFKIPRVLSEFVVQIDTESKIRLNEPSYEIKRIDKQVFLKQCKYIPSTDKVFIEGYIRENIEYATKDCTRYNVIAGNIKDITVHIPFKVYTKVDFCNGEPLISSNPPPTITRYFDEKRMGKDIRVADRSNIEFYNEPIYCELEWSAIYDADINDRGKAIGCMPNEEEFKEFIDKSVIYLCIKLLQKQQVEWPFPPPCPKPRGKKKESTHESDWAKADFLEKGPEKKKE